MYSFIQLTDSSLCKFVTSHSDLQTLILQWNLKFTKKFIEELVKHCKNLRNLTFLMCTQFKDEMAQEISKLSKLQTLCIENAPITDVGLTSMISGSSSSLHELSLIDCIKVTDEGVEKIKNCTSLYSLQLQGNA